MPSIASGTGLQSIGPPIAGQKTVDGRQIVPAEVHLAGTKEVIVLWKVMPERLSQQCHVACACGLLRIWQPRWIDEVALFETKRLRSLIHRRDKSGFTAAHRLRQHHGGIVAGLGDYAKDVVLHGDLISRGKP